MADKKVGENRRDFLKLAATGAPVAAVAAVVAPKSAEAALPTDETRLQDTEHTRKYLETARF
ncbi:MAG: twin-arginine translocation signal domain-containing protein [Paracoccaceae bacterium]|nr:twin-arginine translocation signal domain-containing protein [Paracoccaceae bacterium]MDG1373515.1 twin-arginine translocation signal domain-containing protein [Paracoccaceae bacterium]